MPNRLSPYDLKQIRQNFKNQNSNNATRALIRLEKVKATMKGDDLRASFWADVDTKIQYGVEPSRAVEVVSGEYQTRRSLPQFDINAAGGDWNYWRAR
jgi:hypothetical protein